MRTTSSAVIFLAAGALFAACAKKESASADSTGAMNAPASSTASAAPSAATTSGDTIVRGTISQVSDTALTITTSAGAVRIALTQPVKVYTRNRGDLSRVTDNAFVGITSVQQPDGSQRATEIHVFPEDLRGLGEGSRPMSAPSGGSKSTMTNGSVSGSRMTNGSARMTNGAARMAIGTSSGAASGTVTVTYNGGSQTITVPPDVPVTVLEATTQKLTPGMTVVVAGTRGADGSIRSSRVMLSTGSPRR